MKARAFYAPEERTLTSTLAIFNLVGDDLTQTEDKMRQIPSLPGFRTSTVGDADNGMAPPHVLHQVLDHLMSSGGKRVRPAIALLVNRMYPADLEKRVALAAAIELLHTATLVHDDLIDGALLRRGTATLNATWTPGATVLAGDYLFAHAADLAAQAGNVRVMRLFARTLMIICTGEIRQMFDKQAAFDRQRYYDRIYAKTAALFAVAAEAAAVLGGAPERAVRALREYGAHIGLAFQIVDDVLDFTSDEARLGKPVGSDLRSGLVTAPTLWYLEQNGSHPLLLDILGDGRTDESAIQSAVRLVAESGAIQAALDEAGKFVCKSQEALESLPPGEYRDALWELGNFVAERTR
jgi:geranylgeranyl pyrophosphate synthase